MNYKTFINTIYVDKERKIENEVILFCYKQVKICFLKILECY